MYAANPNALRLEIMGENHVMSRFVKRKWGWYLTILDRKHFKVKLLRFNGRESLSKQYHTLRNEVWLFLSGIGIFTLGGINSTRVHGGDYTLIQRGELHQYHPWSKTLVLEIQYGDKCEESDIVRI